MHLVKRHSLFIYLFVYFLREKYAFHVFCFVHPRCVGSTADLKGRPLPFSESIYYLTDKKQGEQDNKKKKNGMGMGGSKY